MPAGFAASTFRAWWLAFLLAVSASASAHTMTGFVVGVVDGETIMVRDADLRTTLIRVMGIDVPEPSQPFGQAAKNAVTALVLNRNVIVEWTNLDRFGHIFAKVIVATDPHCQGPACPGQDVGLSQLGTGMAWRYRQGVAAQSPADRNAYAQAEFRAKVNRLGVWSSKSTTPPWALPHEQR